MTTERDFNQELEKTRGLAHALTMALKEFIYAPDLKLEREDYRVQAIWNSGEVLADRLDDLCEMNAQG